MITSTMPVINAQDKVKTAARFIGGLVNMHTTVESEFLEMKSTPFCLMCNTKGKSENPWTGEMDHSDAYTCT